ncbi:hypothetical protein [Streptomyces bambusae]|uniref:Uncharacterized protein n=1 Tax=Streptomyces bambusae TaxID=1550616 RepID=A0ABS6Z499_9ACTN|nr:hypothetical protein [Streptomyces bambusae]MBW5482580.1 hypothetical protein [Streptomyces bambusae]
MDHKTLSAVIPGLGQAGARTLLHTLVDAGHMCQVRERVQQPHSSRWVTRTYFSRTPRDRDWWLAYCQAAGVEPYRLPPKDLAYQVLARLKEADPQLVLSAAECEQLAPLAEQWLERGATAAELTQAVTAGLPRNVVSPAGLVRSRLESKMPPEPMVETEEDEVVVERYFACMFCDQDERTVPIINGACPDCLREINCEQCRAIEASVPKIPATFLPGPSPEQVQRYADAVRAAAGLPTKGRR